MEKTGFEIAEEFVAEFHRLRPDASEEDLRREFEAIWLRVNAWNVAGTCSAACCLAERFVPRFRYAFGLVADADGRTHAHAFLEADDGTIWDPTADQFRGPLLYRKTEPYTGSASWPAYGPWRHVDGSEVDAPPPRRSSAYGSRRGA